MGRRALVVPVVALLLMGAVWSQWLNGWLTRPEGVRSSIPVPTARFNISVIELPPRFQACIVNAPIGADVGQAVFTAVTLKDEVRPPLGFAIYADGYEYERTVPAGWTPGAPIGVPVTEQPREGLRGKVCIYNGGEKTIGLHGTEETRDSNLVSTELNGTDIQADVALEFNTAQPSSRLSRADTMIERAMALGGGGFGTWLGWVLVVLVGIGTPVVVLFGAVRVLRADDR